MASAISVSANDLIAWADKYTSRFTLPQLLRRLILASGKNVAKLRLPSEEQVSRPGYDGIVQVEVGNAWLPSGLSVWEMGVDKQPAVKANKDYTKRNKKPGVRRSAATFVFVTPRTWLGRDKWCRSKGGGKKWKAVQVLDSSDLHEWLDSVPSVAFWAARLLGRRPPGVCDITAHWENIRDLSTPTLTPHVFLAGREANVKSVGEWLANESEAAYVEAESQDEVIDFFCALAMSRADDARVEEAQGVIAETPDAFRDASASTVPLILLARFEIDPQLIRQAVRNGHHVLVPASTGSPSLGRLIKLRRLPVFETEKVLINAGFEFQRAKRIARECGGSSLVLKRLVVNGPPKLPPWASPAFAPKLAPFLFVGAWDDANAEDRCVVSEITGLSELEVRALVQQWSRSSDPYFRRKENTWRLVSRVDSWRWLVAYLEQRGTDAYAKWFPEVLALDDPKFDLKPEERIMASILEKKLRFSGALRKGMAETYAMFSVSYDDTTELPSAGVRISLWKLFESVFPADMTWRRWASVGDTLQLFAEASPDPCLNVIERELSKNPPSLAGLFGQEHFFGGSPITGVMWALEVLGWSPNYLLPVTLCLARLSELDSGGNWNPRPFGVLTSLFNPRFPQTTASIDRRFEVLDELASRNPGVAWKLLLHLLPKGGGIAMYNQQPRWRNWCDGWDKGVRNAKQVTQEFDLVADRIVALATGHPRRLVGLLDHITHFKAAARERLFDALRQADVTTLDDSTREGLSKSLAEFIADTRRVENAWWALPKTIIDELEVILERIRPADLCLRHRWLFQQWPQLPGLTYETPPAERETALTTMRTSALAEICQVGGPILVRRMAEESAAPWSVGATAAAAKLIPDDAVLPYWLTNEASKLAEAARAFARTRFNAEGWPWIRSMPTSQWDPAQIASLALGLPFEPNVWDFLNDFDEAAVDGYWNLSAGYNPALLLSDFERAIKEWLRRKRPSPVIELLSLILDQHSPSTSLVLEALEILLVVATQAEVNAEIAWGGYRVGKLIKYLQSNLPSDAPRLLALEWSFLPLLLQAGESPRTLFTALDRQPSLFVELLGTMYRRTDERDKPKAELSQQEKNRAGSSRQLLDEWRVLPGTRQDGSVDEATLRAWAEGVRESAAEQKLEDVADYRMGELFAHAPAEADGIWPCLSVRRILEDWKSDELESGVRCERFNEYQPGSATKPIPEITWDELVQKHRGDAQKVAGRWPRTAAMLRELAASYEGTARRHARDRFHDD